MGQKIHRQVEATVSGFWCVSQIHSFITQHMKIQGQPSTYPGASTSRRRLGVNDVFGEDGGIPRFVRKLATDICAKSADDSQRRTKSLELFQLTTRQNTAPSRVPGLVDNIYSRVPTFDSGYAIVVQETGTPRVGERSKSTFYGSEALRPLLPSGPVLPQEIPENTADVATFAKNPKECVTNGETPKIATVTLAHREKDLPWNWKTQNLGELVQVCDEPTSNDLARPYGMDDSSQDIEDIAKAPEPTWLTARKASPIPKPSSFVTFLEPQNDTLSRHYDGAMRAAGVSAGEKIAPQDGGTEGNNGSWPARRTLSFSENDRPIPAPRKSQDAGSSRLHETNFRAPGDAPIYPFPFPPTEDVPASPVHGGIPLDSLEFVQDPQHDRPGEVNFGYPFPQIPRNNPILPYLNVQPLCPAGRPPIPNLVEMIQIAPGTPEDMGVPRSWWHYFYRSAVPSHAFQNDRQPSLDLPEMDHWSIDVESTGDTRPPSPMTETYPERQQRRLRRAICNRAMKIKLEKIRNFVITGPKMVVAVILWMLRWCGLGRSSAGWYG